MQYKQHIYKYVKYLITKRYKVMQSSNKVTPMHKRKKVHASDDVSHFQYETERYSQTKASKKRQTKRK